MFTYKLDKKGDVADRIICNESNKILFINTFKYVIKFATKNI